MSYKEKAKYLNNLSGDLQASLDNKVNKNADITGATKTKITYDAKGLITSGADATTADIADSTNKRYCTDAEKTVIGNTSGTNTGDETATTLGSKINGATAKTSFVAADMFALMDSEASNVLKKISGTSVQATLKTYFDTVYQPLDATLTALAALDSSAGSLYQTGADTFVKDNAATATSRLNAFVGDSGSGGTKGLVPAPTTGDANKFLKGDGTWATQSGLSDGDKGDITVSNSGTEWTIDNNTINTAKLASQASKDVSGLTIGNSNKFKVLQSDGTNLILNLPIQTYTTTQRDALTNVPTNYIISNSTTGVLEKYNGSGWDAVAPSPSASYELTTNKNQANGYAGLDGNSKIDINQIPDTALSRLVVVADQTARFALTTTQVQNGDTVKQADTSKLYYVKDQTNLNSESGYDIYYANTDWSSVSNKPTDIFYKNTDTLDAVGLWRHQANPDAPPSGFTRSYFKSDNKWYSKNSAGTETAYQRVYDPVLTNGLYFNSESAFATGLNYPQLVWTLSGMMFGDPNADVAFSAQELNNPNVRTASIPTGATAVGSKITSTDKLQDVFKKLISTRDAQAVVGNAFDFNDAGYFTDSKNGITFAIVDVQTINNKPANLGNSAWYIRTEINNKTKTQYASTDGGYYFTRSAHGSNASVDGNLQSAFWIPIGRVNTLGDEFPTAEIRNGKQVFVRGFSGTTPTQGGHITLIPNGVAEVVRICGSVSRSGESQEHDINSIVSGTSAHGSVIYRNTSANSADFYGEYKNSAYASQAYKASVYYTKL